MPRRSSLTTPLAAIPITRSEISKNIWLTARTCWPSKATTRALIATISPSIRTLSSKISMPKILHWLLAGTVVMALWPGLVMAHESPEHEIETLTLRIANAGKRVSLLMRRAVEYRSLGLLEKAAADLTEATRLDPKASAAYADLSRVQLDQGKLGEACDNATRSLALMDESSDRGPVFLLRAQIQSARGRFAEALADCELADRKDDIDWYLTRSQLQAELRKHDARVAGLKDGFQRNGSIVLEIEWIEAMIDAGQYGPALERI